MLTLHLIEKYVHGIDKYLYYIINITKKSFSLVHHVVL